jgi:serine protease Do
LNQIPLNNNESLDISINDIDNFETVYKEKIDYEQRIINVVKNVEGSVVSIMASKDLPVADSYTMNPFDMFRGDIFDPFSLYFDDYQPKVEPKYEKKQVSSGSGFIITTDGYIVTNKHVVSDDKADYTVFLNDGVKYTAKIVAVDPLEDFALIKIEANGLKPLALGNSDNLSLGQTVIAIGNALGEFQNTISVGVISGLNRNITASGGNGTVERLTNLLQTDAAINQGNSGGPLLSLDGKVIGMNTAIVATAQNIGFAIPVNKIKNTIEEAVKTGKITVPFIGVYYVQLNKTESEERKLDVDYGALLVSDKGNSAILKDSPAEKSGLKEGDIILSVNKENITVKSPLSTVVRKYKPGETITLEVKRGENILNINLVLGTK